MYIYLIQNNINGKIYIGKSKKDSEKSKKYFGSGIMIVRAITKYGKENFRKYIIKNNIETLLILNNLEKYYIKLLNSQDCEIGYNIAPGGDGGDLYSCLSEERKIERGHKIARYGEQNGMFNNGCKIKHNKNGMFGTNQYKIWEASGLTTVEIEINKNSWSVNQSKSLKKAYEEGRRTRPNHQGELNNNAYKYFIFDASNVLVDTFICASNSIYPPGLLKTFKSGSVYAPKGFNKSWDRNQCSHYIGWRCEIEKINKRS